MSPEVIALAQRAKACLSVCEGIPTELLLGMTPGFLCRLQDRALAERQVRNDLIRELVECARSATLEGDPLPDFVTKAEALLSGELQC